MVRYVRQYNNYTCGPVAIINAIKWSGHKAIIKQDLKRITNECRCDPRNGTSHGNFDRILRIESKGRFRARRRLFPTLEEIDQHLAQPGHSVIINFLRANENGVEVDAHYALLVRTAKAAQEFVQINSFEGETIAKVNSHQLAEDLKHRKSIRGKVYPRAWFLTLANYSL